MRYSASFFVFLALVLVVACDADTQASNSDAAVIEQLREAGSNLEKPHPIEFFLYFPTEAAAESACETLRSRDFSVSVRPSASTSEFLCFATKLLIPTIDELSRLTTELDTLASELGGEYDGWGSPVVD
jgi:hypothetical protein